MTTRGVDYKELDQILNQCDGEYSFRKMLTLLTSSVSPRSLDGLIENSMHSHKYMHNQLALAQVVMQRLASITMFETNGWHRVLSVDKLFTRYGYNPENIILTLERVTHHRTNRSRPSTNEKNNFKVFN